MSNDVQQEIVAAASSNEEIKTTVLKVLSLSSDEQSALQQMLSDAGEEPVMEEAENRDNPGPGVVG